MNIRTTESFNDTVDQIVDLDLRIKKLDAQRAAAVQKVEERFNPQLNDLQKQRETLRESCESYAREHRKDIFGKAKSFRTTIGVCAFRLAKSLKLRIPEEDAVAVLRGSRMDEYIRVRESVDKSGLKRELERDNAAIARIAEITSTETFDIKPRS